MAQYKVPQDVEAEDKLLGPFTFRQFIYLLIAAAGIAGAWGLFQIFPLLALIPLPFVFFFGVLALPIRKDQPMETYLSAVISFYLKPNRRIWTAGQRESTIKIIAPKKVEKSRTRDITEDEASHRLSFLATIVDSEGYAIRGDSAMKDEYAAEANTIEDILDADNPVIDHIIEQEQNARKQELVSQMRTAMNRVDQLTATPTQQPTIPTQSTSTMQQFSQPQPVMQSVQSMPLPQPPVQSTPMPMPPTMQTQPIMQPQPIAQPTVQQLTQDSLNQAVVNQQMQSLANNSTFSIQTIAQQANRIQQQNVQPQPVMQPVQSMPLPQPVQSAPHVQSNNSMMVDHEAGLTAPVFTPMSTPLPHEIDPNQTYRPNNTDNHQGDSRPDLYGPQTAIFSS